MVALVFILMMWKPEDTNLLCCLILKLPNYFRIVTKDNDLTHVAANVSLHITLITWLFD